MGEETGGDTELSAPPEARGYAGRHQLAGRLGFPSSSRDSLLLHPMHPALVPVLCRGRSTGRALFAFREQKFVGGHHGRAGNSESKVAGEEYPRRLPGRRSH